MCRIEFPIIVNVKFLRDFFTEHEEKDVSLQPSSNIYCNAVKSFFSKHFVVL